jgi:hypothetical protein
MLSLYSVLDSVVLDDSSTPFAPVFVSSSLSSTFTARTVSVLLSRAVSSEDSEIAPTSFSKCSSSPGFKSRSLLKWRITSSSISALCFFSTHLIFGLNLGNSETGSAFATSGTTSRHSALSVLLIVITGMLSDQTDEPESCRISFLAGTGLAFLSLDSLVLFWLFFFDKIALGKSNRDWSLLSFTLTKSSGSDSCCSVSVPSSMFWLSWFSSSEVEDLPKAFLINLEKKSGMETPGTNADSVAEDYLELWVLQVLLL